MTGLTHMDVSPHDLDSDKQTGHCFPPRVKEKCSVCSELEFSHIRLYTEVGSAFYDSCFTLQIYNQKSALQTEVMRVESQNMLKIN